MGENAIYSSASPSLCSPQSLTLVSSLIEHPQLLFILSHPSCFKSHFISCFSPIHIWVHPIFLNLYSHPQLPASDLSLQTLCSPFFNLCLFLPAHSLALGQGVDERRGTSTACISQLFSENRWDVKRESGGLRGLSMFLAVNRPGFNLQVLC